jgi:hypothetical protein
MVVSKMQYTGRPASKKRSCFSPGTNSNNALKDTKIKVDYFCVKVYIEKKALFEIHTDVFF